MIKANVKYHVSIQPALIFHLLVKLKLLFRQIQKIILNKFTNPLSTSFQCLLGFQLFKQSFRIKMARANLLVDFNRNGDITLVMGNFVGMSQCFHHHKMNGLPMLFQVLSS